MRIIDTSISIMNTERYIPLVDVRALPFTNI